MKKLLFILTCLFCLNTVVMADDDKPIRFDQLPKKAQQFVNNNFKDSKVTLTKVDTDWFDKAYEVIFTNGDKIEFNKSGDWTEIDCRHNAVPANAVPQTIKNYIRDNYSDAKVLKIEKDAHRYEVKLSNKVELEFDNKFNLIDIDF